MHNLTQSQKSDYSNKYNSDPYGCEKASNESYQNPSNNKDNDYKLQP